MIHAGLGGGHMKCRNLVNLHNATNRHLPLLHDLFLLPDSLLPVSVNIFQIYTSVQWFISVQWYMCFSMFVAKLKLQYPGTFHIKFV